ncbi:glycosyltransferase family 4 protein [Deinococcus sp. A31D244]|uniref:glycosyltransferase family 4 protein n=1 Tax=Deinococcus sp. A31D244 TaxID=3397675 RepID=UPI0039E1328A
MISSDYLPNIGGIAAHVHYLSKYISQSEQIFGIFGHKRSDRPVNRSISGKYIQKSEGKLKGIDYSLRFIKALVLTKPYRYDIVHCHNFVVEGFICAFLRKIGLIKQFVFTNHSSQFLSAFYQKKSISKIYKFILESADKIICPSIELAQTSSKLTGRDDVIYIPNGVDLSQFHFIDAPHQKFKKPYFLLTRRHEYKNGLLDFLNALKNLIEQLEDFDVIIAGSGSLTGDLKKYVTDHNLHNVKFIGNKTHEELVEYYGNAIASCLPSHFEAVSISGLESLACGTPIIGSNVGGIPEIVIDGQTGFLHTKEDPDSISRCILEILEIYKDKDVMSAMRSRCRELVVNGYSWESIANKTIGAYKQ